jgi:hypothetical protein
VKGLEKSRLSGDGFGLETQRPQMVLASFAGGGIWGMRFLSPLYHSFYKT